MNWEDEMQSGDGQFSLWQGVILILSVVVLVGLFVETAIPISQETAVLLRYFDTAICIIFLGDFIYQFIRADNKLRYLKWGWIDLVASLPNVSFLRWGRIVRVVRIFRLLNSIRSVRLMLGYFRARKIESTLIAVTLLSFLVMFCSAIAMLNCEVGPDANIRTAADALWWSFVTMTTVGYGDYYPVTVGGRVVACILMIVGVGLFGTFTAYFASLFVEAEEEKHREQMILEELQELRCEVKCLREEQYPTMDEIR